MDSLSDEQLIVLVMAGATSALEPLVKRYHGPLLGYLYRLTNGNRALAEDLVQETFLRLLRQETYQSSRPFKPWVYSIATHLAYDYFRSQSARPTTPVDEEALANWADPSPSPEEQTNLSSEGLAVAAALCQLGEEYQAALLLRFYEGLSLQEIADALHIPLGTVKSRLSVGTQRLRSLLIEIKQGE